VKDGDDAKVDDANDCDDAKGKDVPTRSAEQYQQDDEEEEEERQESHTALCMHNEIEVLEPVPIEEFLNRQVAVVEEFKIPHISPEETGTHLMMTAASSSISAIDRPKKKSRKNKRGHSVTNLYSSSLLLCDDVPSPPLSPLEGWEANSDGPMSSSPSPHRQLQRPSSLSTDSEARSLASTETSNIHQHALVSMIKDEEPVLPPLMTKKTSRSNSSARRLSQPSPPDKPRIGRDKDRDSSNANPKTETLSSGGGASGGGAHISEFYSLSILASLKLDFFVAASNATKPENASRKYTAACLDSRNGIPLGSTQGVIKGGSLEASPSIKEFPSLGKHEHCGVSSETPSPTTEASSTEISVSVTQIKTVMYEFFFTSQGHLRPVVCFLVSLIVAFMITMVMEGVSLSFHSHRHHTHTIYPYNQDNSLLSSFQESIIIPQKSSLIDNTVSLQTAAVETIQYIVSPGDSFQIGIASIEDRRKIIDHTAVRWLKDGVDFDQQYLHHLQDDSLVYSIPSMDSTYTGEYECSVLTRQGEYQVIARAVVRIPTPPSIRTKASYSTLIVGQTFLISLTAEGTPPPTYQWYKNGLLLSGQTSPTLHFTYVEMKHSGTYSCLLENNLGSVMWLEAMISVRYNSLDDINDVNDNHNH
jgi:hypothetical protein